MPALQNEMQALFTRNFRYFPCLSDKEYKGSYHYSVEYWDNENWIPVCCPAVPDEEVKISPGESQILPHLRLPLSDQKFDSHYWIPYIPI